MRPHSQKQEAVSELFLLRLDVVIFLVETLSALLSRWLKT